MPRIVAACLFLASCVIPCIAIAEPIPLGYVGVEIEVAEKPLVDYPRYSLTQIAAKMHDSGTEFDLPALSTADQPPFTAACRFETAPYEARLFTQVNLSPTDTVTLMAFATVKINISSPDLAILIQREYFHIPEGPCTLGVEPVYQTSNAEQIMEEFLGTLLKETPCANCDEKEISRLINQKLGSLPFNGRHPLTVLNIRAKHFWHSNLQPEREKAFRKVPTYTQTEAPETARDPVLPARLGHITAPKPATATLTPTKTDEKEETFQREVMLIIIGFFLGLGFSLAVVCAGFSRNPWPKRWSE